MAWMATYVYRCDDDGDVDVVLPIGTAPPHRPCPACAAAMSRVFVAPMVGRVSRAHLAAVDRSERTRDSPDVVSAPPPGPRRTPVTRDPRHAKLPRP